MIPHITYGVALFIATSTVAYAHSAGGGGSERPKERRVIEIDQPQIENRTVLKDVHGKLIQKKEVNDFTLRFKVVDVTDSVPDGGSHNLLVNIQQDGRTQYDLSVTASVENINGDTKSKSMMELGDWYLAGYDFSHDARYNITVLFTSTDGIDHSSTIEYPN